MFKEITESRKTGLLPQLSQFNNMLKDVQNI